VNFMKTQSLLWICLLLATAAANAQQAPVVVKTGFLSGADFRVLSSEGKRGYVQGFTDGVFVAPLFKALKSEVIWIESCITGMTDVQLVAILEKWLADNPARWHNPMNVLAYNSLRETCPK
jgi:hypothetical protein